MHYDTLILANALDAFARVNEAPEVAEVIRAAASRLRELRAANERLSDALKDIAGGGGDAAMIAARALTNAF